MWMKPNSHNPGSAIRPQKQWTVNLYAEKATRLTMPFPRLEKLERLAQIEDQFRMTIGDHSLGRSAFAIVLQSPEAFDELLELRLSAGVWLRLCCSAGRAILPQPA